MTENGTLLVADDESVDAVTHLDLVDVMLDLDPGMLLWSPAEALRS